MTIANAPSWRTALPFCSLLAFVLCGAFSGCKKHAIDTPERIAERASWRAAQDQEMRGALSPLSRIDYVHLPAGEHVVKEGAPPLKLAADAIASYRGELRLRVDASGMSFTATEPVQYGKNLKSQSALKPHDVITIGRLRLLITDVSKDPAIAIYDPEAPARRAYQGLHYYLDDADYVTTGTLERYAAPRKVRVAATRGEDRELDAVGTLRFSLLGQAASIEAYSEEPGSNRLFLIFRDATCGKKGMSYGAGRYLYATPNSDGSVPLDFNQAWNPLCAYSPFFHCPVPPRGNVISLSIPVGEKVYSEH